MGILTTKVRLVGALVVGMISTGYQEVAPQERVYFESEREITYLTRGAVQERFGCEWFKPCSVVKDAIPTHGYPYLYPQVTAGPYLDALVGRVEYRLFHSGKQPIVLVLDADGGEELLAVLRRFGNEDKEYRPLFSPNDSGYEQEERSSIERREFSGSFEDITAYSAEFISGRELASFGDLGLKWGDDFPGVRRKLEKAGIRPQDLEELLRTTPWYMPELQQFSEKGRETPYSWSRGNDIERGFFLFRAADAATVFVMDIHAERGLEGIIKYSHNGSMSVVRDARRRVVRKKLPSERFSQSPFEATRWDDEEPNCETLDELRDRKSYDSDSREDRILVDPAKFFRGEGAAFASSWFKEREHSYAPDYSWKVDGRTYYACIDQSWILRPPPAAMPSWHILEFDGGKLSKIYEYNEYWELTEIRPPYSPRSMILATLTSVGLLIFTTIFWQRHLRKRRRLKQLFGVPESSSIDAGEEDEEQQRETRRLLPRKD